MRSQALSTAPAAASGRLSDLYLIALCGVLCGYAVLGKGFAYIGFPPLYVGEMALLTGMLVFLRINCLIGVFTTLPTILLAAMMVWVIARMVPFLRTDGVEALRDSVMVTYGGFALVVIALIIEDTSRIRTLLRYYGIFIGTYVQPSGVLYLVERFLGNATPDLPGTHIHLLDLKPGDAAVHLCGALVFVFAGLQKKSRLWTVLTAVCLAAIGTLSRGPLLAGVLPIVLAAVLLGRVRQLVRICVVAAAIFCVAYAIEPLFYQYHNPMSSQTRPISTRQVVVNVESLFGYGDQQAEGTKLWRIEFWHAIIADTIEGPHFWAGRGFGLNLADAYGFPGDNDPKLRDPHDVVMTMLARGGVIGVTLWLGFLAAWFTTMLHAVLLARWRQQREWTGLFVFLTCYPIAIIINSLFDPSLEGPMEGVWFWCLVGLGIASVMTYRRHKTPPLITTEASPA